VPKAYNLPPSRAVVTKFGILNFLEPSGPLQACNRTAVPNLIVNHILYTNTHYISLHIKCPLRMKIALLLKYVARLSVQREFTKAKVVFEGNHHIITRSLFHIQRSIHSHLCVLNTYVSSYWIFKCIGMSRCVWVLSSRPAQRSKCLHLQGQRPENALRNIGSYLFNDTTSRHSRVESSSSPLCEPQISHFPFFFYMEIKGRK